MARIDNFNNREAFTFYSNFDEYEKFINDTLPKVPRNYGSLVYDNYTRVDDPDFIGSGDVDLLNSKLTSFIDPPALDNSIEKIKELFSLINLGGAFAKDRMVATDLPIGVFDFSLASKGLYRAQEYYCEALNKIIEPDLVKKISNNPIAFTYTENKDGLPHTYNVIQQQEGTFEILKMTQYVNGLIASGTPENEAKNLGSEKYPKAKLIFRTTTKKVNLIRRSKTLKENEAGNEKYVDLFITIGGLASQTPRSLMYKAMPCLLVAYFINKAGIKTRILGLNAFTQSGGIESDSDRKKYRFADTFVIKEYEDNFDFNEIAILTADSRVFRWKMFKAITTSFFAKLNYDSGSGLGGVFKGEGFKKMFERYKNFYIQTQKAKGGIKNQNSRLMFASEVTPNPNWNDDEMMNMVTEEFFRIVDAIDIEFNGAQTSLPRIKEREIARQADISNLRQRLIGTINTATNYDESNSPYSTSDKDIQDRLAKRQKLTDDVNKVIRVI
jgi:hypothetical protein